MCCQLSIRYNELCISELIVRMQQHAHSLCFMWSGGQAQSQCGDSTISMADCLTELSSIPTVCTGDVHVHVLCVCYTREAM